LIGVIWALFLTGISLSMISIMSFIMLVGVVVNNAILIIDYTHQLQRSGKPRAEAIVEACRVKFAPVLMMNLAIVLASLPQAINVKSIQGPFAITAIGGIIVSTVMTLYVIPALYAMGGRKALKAR
jgi:HAE1 family hydrophobic/amphiphilic exporter-1